MAEKAVIPQVISFDSDSISMAYDVMHVEPIVALMFCATVTEVKVKMLPPFIPNEHLFAREPNKERWRVYAGAVREVMRKEGNLKLTEQPLREKLEYMSELGSL